MEPNNNRFLLSIGIISASLELFRLATAYRLREEDLSLHDMIGEVRINYLLPFVLGCRWIRKTEDGTLKLNEGAKKYLSIDSQTSILQMMILDYITELKPIWSGSVIRGRDTCVEYMSPDERVCFDMAKLLDDSKDTAYWWKHLETVVRNENALELAETGIDGEDLSIKYETRRIGIRPKWMALECNTLGYDILSQVDETNTKKLRIEVKSSHQSIEKATAYISKNEWEQATIRSPSAYLFHFWLLDKSNKLAIVSVDDLIPHVPSNNNDGKWEKFMVPFSIFKTKFKEIQAY